MDTLQKKHDLTGAGFSDEQAEALIEVMRDELATKQDLQTLKNQLRWQIPATTITALALLLTLFQIFG